MQRVQKPGTSAQRVRRRRDKLRAAGLRPVQIWVPDTRAAGFAEECARQSRRVRASEEADDFLQRISDTTGWTA